MFGMPAKVGEAQDPAAAATAPPEEEEEEDDEDGNDEPDEEPAPGDVVADEGAVGDSTVLLL
jgi:hypothetical protein